MANTISAETYRRKYFSANIAQVLRGGLVCKAIFNEDTSNSKRIENPYGSQPTATVHAIGGTYAITDFTTTDDTLTITDQVSVSNHIYEFEETLTEFDLMANRLDEMMFAVKAKIDRYALNVITEEATGTYTTPTGGFTTASNVNTILGNLISKVSGYDEMYKGMFLVIENTDVAGFVVAQASNGYSYADMALNNGFLTSQLGVDIYVVRASTFADETLGTETYTNNNHRLFGIKNVATYAVPGGVQYDEKKVTGKTGREVVVFANIGAKAWYTKTDLLVDITLA